MVEKPIPQEVEAQSPSICRIQQVIGYNGLDPLCDMILTRMNQFICHDIINYEQAGKLVPLLKRVLVNKSLTFTDLVTCIDNMTHIYAMWQNEELPFDQEIWNAYVDLWGTEYPNKYRAFTIACSHRRVVIEVRLALRDATVGTLCVPLGSMQTLHMGLSLDEACPIDCTLLDNPKRVSWGTEYVSLPHADLSNLITYLMPLVCDKTDSPLFIRALIQKNPW